MTLLQFMGESPFLTFFLALILASVIKYPFVVLKRYLRHRDISKHGWPTTPNMDADGDIVQPEVKA